MPLVRNIDRFPAHPERDNHRYGRQEQVHPARDRCRLLLRRGIGPHIIETHGWVRSAIADRWIKPRG
jgi:hypothetical protein